MKKFKVYEGKVKLEKFSELEFRWYPIWVFMCLLGAGVFMRTDAMKGATVSHLFWFSPCWALNEKFSSQPWQAHLQLPLNPSQEGCHVKSFPPGLLARFFPFGGAHDSPVYQTVPTVLYPVFLQTVPTHSNKEILLTRLKFPWWIGFLFVYFIVATVSFSTIYFESQTSNHKRPIIDFLCYHAYLAYFFQPA